VDAVPRSYAGPADLRAMQRLTQRIWSAGSGWHIGGLAWSRFQHLGREPEWPTALWRAGPDVVGWGWATLPAGLALQSDPAGLALQCDPADLALQCDPAVPGLPEEILRWFDGVAASGSRKVTVLDAEAHLISALGRHGYLAREDGPFHIHLARPLAGLPAPEPPPPFALRAVRGGQDAPARAAVHRTAFHPSRVTADSYRTVMTAWPYRPELDWVAEAPDGELASFCLAWLDDERRVAELEPVGTDPRYRRLGLARATCLAALHAARQAGATTAIVAARGDAAYQAPIRLYQDLGFRPYARTISFTS
jgi:GNAT superfamily N-acetyltransferase